MVRRGGSVVSVRGVCVCGSVKIYHVARFKGGEEAVEGVCKEAERRKKRRDVEEDVRCV